MTQYQRRRKKKQSNWKTEQRIWIDFFLHKEIQMTDRHVERCLTLLVIREIQSKAHWDITSHLAEYLLSNRQQGSLGEDVEKRKLMCTVGGHVNWYSFYGKPYGASSKRLKLKLPYNPTIPILNIFLQKKNTNTNSKRYTHLNVHCSLIYYCQEMEATKQVSGHWRCGTDTRWNITWP